MYSPGYPGTPDLPASTSPVVLFEASTNIPSHKPASVIDLRMTEPLVLALLAELSLSGKPSLPLSDPQTSCHLLTPDCKPHQTNSEHLASALLTYFSILKTSLPVFLRESGSPVPTGQFITFCNSSSGGMGGVDALFWLPWALPASVRRLTCRQTAHIHTIKGGKGLV